MDRRVIAFALCDGFDRFVSQNNPITFSPVFAPPPKKKTLVRLQGELLDQIPLIRLYCGTLRIVVSWQILTEIASPSGIF